MTKTHEYNLNQEIMNNAALKVSEILDVPVGNINKTKLVYLYTLLYNMLGQRSDRNPCDEEDDNMRHWINTYNTHLEFCHADGLIDGMPEIISYLESFL